MHRSRLLSLAVLLLPGAAWASDFQPDPRTVQWYPPLTPHTGPEEGGKGERQQQRYGPAYRYPQAGWIVLHIEGKPYERGVQHGHLLAPEIAAHLRCFAATQCPKDPSNGWKQTRILCNALFLRRYDPEYLEEMKGIADGASAAGARFDNRPVDLLDLVALNAWPEVDTLPSALEATPTGLEGKVFGQDAPNPKPSDKPMRCSAFAAVGPATKDGKIVFGHITMFGLYPSSFYNVWLDIKPEKGRRVLMQSYPGGIQSGLDYYMNDAGILVSETTLAQTRFDIKGEALASRIRRAVQYGESIDQVAAILNKDNNGLYTNEWLIADTKTNEIAMFELGTHKTKLWRSSKNEWYGGTEGFYWGCNNTKDLQVRLETIPGVEGRPSSAVFRPSDRDKMWLKLYDAHKGKIDADFGKLAFTTPPLAAFHSVDAKFTTTDMAKDLKTWALFGPPLGRAWHPTFADKEKYPEIQPLAGNPWTVLTAAAPPKVEVPGPAVVDLHDVETGRTRRGMTSRDAVEPTTVPAWHGTVLPAEDGDVWLASAFAGYERIVALEKGFRKRSAGRTDLLPFEKERLSVALYAYRAEYQLGSRAAQEAPLTRTKADVRQDEWYKVASGKGVLFLHALRQHIGAERFDEIMDEFGRTFAGKPVRTKEFLNFVESRSKKPIADLAKTWLEGTGLPADRGGVFSVQTFHSELESTLIVYGTQDETAMNKEAAELLQKAIIERHSNFTVPIKADRDVTEDDVKKHHLLLIGRPDCNTLTQRFRDALPVTFGMRSFVVRDEAYAHAGSGVMAAAENPENRRYSIVVLAGLSPAATLRTAPLLAHQRPTEIVVCPNGSNPRATVKELIWDAK
jgi:hypothetical protein